MKTPDDFKVSTVYSYDTPNDLKNYYNDWAHEYEDYTDQVNYILPQKVVEIFCSYQLSDNSTVLDIGCGTGLVGYFLGLIKQDIWIEGTDISGSMIQVAAKKTKPNFKPTYDWMIVQDFKKNKLLLENHYDGIISAGTFTLGHLDCNDLITSIKFLKKDGLATISIKEDHFIKNNFNEKISKLKKDNIIKNVEYFKVNSYDSDFIAQSIVVKFNKV
jgi:predicted TPR repeat methyltransferase